MRVRFKYGQAFLVRKVNGTCWARLPVPARPLWSRSATVRPSQVGQRLSR